MAEKRTAEDVVLSGITRIRQSDGYSTLFRMGAGMFHAFNTVINGIGGASLILGRDLIIDTAHQNGMGLQASSNIGMGVALLGGIALGLALFNAWAALSLFMGRQQAYWYLVLINLASFLWMVFMASPTTAIQWVQLVLSFVVAALLLFDPRIKVFYHKGPLAKTEWNDEPHHHINRAGDY